MLFAFALLSILAFPSQVHGESSISQGFKTTDPNISTGSLISVTTKGGNIAGLANTKNVPNMVGVAGNKPLIELSNSNENNLKVIVSGSTAALVSDINGTVNFGDKITASPIDGLGMKAVNSGEIVGTAQTDLKSVQTVTKSVTKSDGSKSTIKVGVIPLEVNVSYYTAPDRSAVSQYLPAFMQSLANSISGKQVSPWRVLIGSIALLLGFAASMVMLYSSVRSNMISIGRNPLARGALHKGFLDVAMFAVGVLLITMVATFIILSI
ncbi:MAG TPA: hypothetical protein VLG47_01085 [Candidatus Saccharimonadales bacterium]|nr:hypothetical protein [Candidatus Saccharimonadales bacterium]